MPPRRFQKPQPAPRDAYGPWAAVIAVLLLAWVVFVVAFLPRDAAADHDDADQPWRRPLLEACAATWDYTSTRVTVDAPGHPQHGRSLHDQPWEVRDIFYRTWFRDTEDERAVDAHLIQWRREYECTHPKGVVLAPVPAMVTVGGRLPRGGGGYITVPSGLTPPPGNPGSQEGDCTGDACPEPEHRYGRLYRWHCHEGTSPGGSVVTAAGFRVYGEDGNADGLCNEPGEWTRTWHAHFMKSEDDSTHCHGPWVDGETDEDSGPSCPPPSN